MHPRLYQLGSNLLLNGDCISADQVRLLYSIHKGLECDRVELCRTDPPYGVALVRVHGDLQPFNTLPIANDSLPDDIFTEFLVQSIGNTISAPILFNVILHTPAELLLSLTN